MCRREFGRFPCGVVGEAARGVEEGEEAFHGKWLIL